MGVAWVRWACVERGKGPLPPLPFRVAHRARGQPPTVHETALLEPEDGTEGAGEEDALHARKRQQPLGKPLGAAAGKRVGSRVGSKGWQGSWIGGGVSTQEADASRG